MMRETRTTTSSTPGATESQEPLMSSADLLVGLGVAVWVVGVAIFVEVRRGRKALDRVARGMVEALGERVFHVPRTDPLAGVKAETPRSDPRRTIAAFNAKHGAAPELPANPPAGPEPSPELRAAPGEPGPRGGLDTLRRDLDAADQAQADQAPETVPPDEDGAATMNVGGDGNPRT
jgi:hypothetical protein